MISPIHNCLETSLQNEYYKEKLTEFYKENKKLKEQIKQLISQNEESNHKNKTTEIGIQTNDESIKSTSKQTVSNTKCSVCENKQKKSNLEVISSLTDNDIYNKQNKKSYVKLCEMQHTLLKKYEDEVNSNAVKQDLINHMKLELDSLTAEKTNLKHENDKLHKQVDVYVDLESRCKKLVLDNETLKLKLKKYKTDLKCFDKTFFDDLEELKRKYDESIRLNKHYEQLLYELDESKNSSKKVTFEKSNLNSNCNDSSFNESFDYQNLIDQLNE